jgi:hypothetical protein
LADFSDVEFIFADTDEVITQLGFDLGGFIADPIDLIDQFFLLIVGNIGLKLDNHVEVRFTRFWIGFEIEEQFLRNTPTPFEKGE